MTYGVRSTELNCLSFHIAHSLYILLDSCENTAASVILLDSWIDTKVFVFFANHSYVINPVILTPTGVVRNIVWTPASC